MNISKQDSVLKPDITSPRSTIKPHACAITNLFIEIFCQDMILAGCVPLLDHDRPGGIVDSLRDFRVRSAGPFNPNMYSITRMS